jgi:hypothetical protein
MIRWMINAVFTQFHKPSPIHHHVYVGDKNIIPKWDLLLALVTPHDRQPKKGRSHGSLPG